MENQIVIPRIITTSFVVSHPHYIFVYGDNLYNSGMLGQPWNMAKEPNTFHVPTLIKLCPSAPDKFFSDYNFETHKEQIMECINKIPRDGRPIIVLRKIGEGMSQMSFKAPKLFKFMKDELAKIAYPNIKIDYYAN